MPSGCKTCGEHFTKRSSLDRFCSPKCAIQHKKPLKRTPLKRGVSKSNLSFSRIKKEMAENVMDESGYISCEHCGITAACDLHHIYYRSEVPNHEFLNDPINLIWVCRDCHEWFHLTKENRVRVAEERGLVKLFVAKSERYSKK